MSKADLLTGLGLMGLGVLVYLLTEEMAKVPAGIGPGDYPRVAGYGLFALGTILALQSFRTRGTPIRTLYPMGAAPRVLLLVLMTFAYIRLMPHLGFLLSTPMFLVAAMILFGVRKPWVIFLTGVGVAAGIYLVFYSFFQILLPRFSLFGV